MNAPASHAQVFLIAPADADPAGFATALAPVLAATDVSALLLPRGAHAENAYKALVKSVVPVAQANNCAVLIEGEPGWVRLLGADGLHVAGPLAAVKQAVAALKPQMIVGATADASRHDAMTKGELDVDYIFFGPLSGSMSADMRDMAQWWAETMQIPAVISDPETLAPSSEGCEFVAVGAQVWTAPQGPAAALTAIAGAIG